MSDWQSRVQVFLPEGVAFTTDNGCYTIMVTDGGTLEIQEAKKGTVAVYAQGFWFGAHMVNPHTTRETA